ncbi:MAG: hypothetical protein A2X19_00025 [Bacteroidetes bacterium GWE2_39_28]|nr:MAG: hypothetical protein A2X19_00025 [Bacteroidetes bacterium GWE2_39_28]OFY14386.1 MAG: hypothetical protein A2X16_05395 [Bacteroidetes bacterium GWF2_39_10]OFZ10277.1 MAG: hypothetical protein A2465_03280 [Bacteroidetes bacterium RIFOXYC2_FULL_39_11]HCT95251.1 hypothetical protein [Rikenellaceae bacterium]
MSLNQKESRSLKKDIDSQNTEHINYFNKGFIVFVNEKQNIISDILTKLYSVKDYHIKRALNNIEDNDKFTIQKVCNRICANLDDVE